MEHDSQPEAYCVHVWIRGIHPMLWRRFLVRSDSTLADLHVLLQIGFDWTDFHLHRFRIRKKDYAVPRPGGLGCHDARQIKLADLHFRINERFLYEYDFGDLWQHQVRIEKRLEIEASRSYPVCVGGQWAGPPEDCGGPQAFLERRAAAPWRVRELLDDLLEDIKAGDAEALDYRIEELQPWQEWLMLHRFDRRRVNRRLRQYAEALIVGLDGGFIHSKDQKSRGEGWFEVIAGKSMPEEGAAKCFAYVQSYDTKPKRRLFELMKSQGLQANQQVTFLSDGADDVRKLPLYLSPESEHWLDWFHVAMRLRVMGQMAKGLVNEQNMTSAQESLTKAGEELDTVDIGKQLERVKWFLWHGNVVRALDTMEDIEDQRDLLPQDGESRKKLLKAVREFRGYIEANQNFIPNYGDRYRHGEKISTAFAESAVNQVVSKRMVKKQQMRWTESGAHNLLQVRTKVLNDQLRETFVRWYPGMQTEQETQIEKKAA